MSTARRDTHIITTMAAALVALSACTADTSSDPATASPSPSAAPSTRASSPDAPSTEPAEAITTTGSEVREVIVDVDGDRSFAPVTREEQLATFWEEAKLNSGLEGDAPPVDLIREVAREEYMTVQIECLTQAGFPPTEVDRAAGVTWETPAEQVDAFALADYTCKAQYPEDPKYIQPYDEDQINIVYDWLIDETIPCYEDQGYIVNDIPSREAFTDQWFTTMGHWIPEDGVEGPVPSDIDTTCPRVPLAAELYR